MSDSALSRALARIDERSHGDRLHDLLVEIDMVNEGAFSATEYDEQTAALNRLAAQFVAPHMQRIAELETRCATYEASEGAWHEATSCHDGADALNMVNSLRARIDELEAELVTFREVGVRILAIHNGLSTWPLLQECAAAIDNLAPHIQKLSAIIAESSMPVARTEQAQESTDVFPGDDYPHHFFKAQRLPVCANCNGTERVVEGGRQIDCPVCT